MVNCPSGLARFALIRPRARLHGQPASSRGVKGLRMPRRCRSTMCSAVRRGASPPVTSTPASMLRRAADSVRLALPSRRVRRSATASLACWRERPCSAGSRAQTHSSTVDRGDDRPAQRLRDPQRALDAHPSLEGGAGGLGCDGLRIAQVAAGEDAPLGRGEDDVAAFRQPRRHGVQRFDMNLRFVAQAPGRPGRRRTHRTPGGGRRGQPVVGGGAGRREPRSRMARTTAPSAGEAGRPRPRGRGDRRTDGAPPVRARRRVAVAGPDGRGAGAGRAAARVVRQAVCSVSP